MPVAESPSGPEPASEASAGRCMTATVPSRQTTGCADAPGASPSACASPFSLTGTAPSSASPASLSPPSLGNSRLLPSAPTPRSPAGAWPPVAAAPDFSGSDAGLGSLAPSPPECSPLDAGQRAASGGTGPLARALSMAVAVGALCAGSTAFPRPRPSRGDPFASAVLTAGSAAPSGPGASVSPMPRSLLHGARAPAGPASASAVWPTARAALAARSGSGAAPGHLCSSGSGAPRANSRASTSAASAARAACTEVRQLLQLARATLKVRYST